jgi:peptidoglycan-associated lipoprotein
MGARKSLLIGVALIAAGAATTGCATKKYAREQAGIVNARVDTVEPRVAAVEGTARDALDRATAAGKLAEGKFLYQMSCRTTR